MAPLLITICLLSGIVTTTRAASSRHQMFIENEAIHDVLQKMLANYSRHIPPNRTGPTNVYLGIYVMSFSSINEQHMDYSLSFILRMAWVDPRLRFNVSEVGIPKLKLSSEMWEKLWIPDLSFRNEKKASLHHIISTNRLLALTHDGSVSFATKITATLTCSMNLKTYPFDVQRCPMMMESFSSTKRIMEYDWMKDSVDLEDGLVLPRYFLERFEQKDCSHKSPLGAYPCLEIDWVLKRDIGFFVFQIFLPSSLIVALSWVGYWIAREAVPARVSICLVTVLTTVTQTHAINKELPQVSYVKAIDIWMAFSLIQVFASLFEYCIVNVLARHDNSRRVQRQHSLKRKPEEAPEPSPNRYKRLAHKVDKFSRFIFPISFLVFNIIYFAVYLSSDNHS